jgi:hypothetical protein
MFLTSGPGLMPARLHLLQGLVPPPSLPLCWPQRTNDVRLISLMSMLRVIAKAWSPRVETADNRVPIRCQDTLPHVRAEAKAFPPSLVRREVLTYCHSVNLERSYRARLIWALPTSVKTTRRGAASLGMGKAPPSNPHCAASLTD